MTKFALVFPGQGSQAVGMGKELAESFAVAREVFQEVDDALSQKLSILMFEGPADELTLTENAQPAIMAASIAALRVLEKETGFDIHTASFVAGHSLGEYSALAAARAISLADTARLLKLRGQAMQRAVPKGEGAMAALLGADLEQAAEIAKEAAQGDVCTVANDNAQGQVVISGARVAVERAAEIAKTKGIKKAVMLPVSAPFHCPLMQPAADAMRDALAKATVNAPIVPVVANVTAEAVSDPQRIRDLLVEQVCAVVRWRESVHYLKAQGIERAIELGAGKVLSGLIKRIEPDMATANVGVPADVDSFAAAA